MIEPTENKEAMGDFIDAMVKILEEANTYPETVIGAPFTLPVLAGRCEGCEGLRFALPQV